MIDLYKNKAEDKHLRTKKMKKVDEVDEVEIENKEWKQIPLIHKRKGKDEVFRSKKRQKKPIADVSRDPLLLMIIALHPKITTILHTPSKMTKTTTTTQPRMALRPLIIQIPSPKKSKFPSISRQIQTTTTTTLQQEKNPQSLVANLPDQTTKLRNDDDEPLFDQGANDEFA